MKHKQMQDSHTKAPQIVTFSREYNFSKFQEVDIKPVFGRKWVTNGINNVNYKTFLDAYDDSPTNRSIINAFVSYTYAEGLMDLNGQDLDKYISQEDVLLACLDLKIFGGFTLQVIWNSNELDKQPLKLEYIPIYKLGINYDVDGNDVEVDGYWYSWDWLQRGRYRPELMHKFTGDYKGQDLEIIMVRRPASAPFFPVPNYLPGVPWAQIEGELANAGKNHFINSMSDITLINVNSGRQATSELARSEADKLRSKVVGTENQSTVHVVFNESAETATTIDRISPPDLNNQNVFYGEEAERKLIQAHSAPAILFAGSNQGSGFSSNADEIEIQTKALYRRHINPDRKIFTNGLKQFFDIIDSKIKLDFKDFESETKLDTNEEDANKIIT